MTVFVSARIPRIPEYQTQTYTYYHQIPEGDNELETFLRQTDWEKLLGNGSPCSMVEKLHERFEEGMKMCFELKKSAKKTSEPPWMTAGIRRLIKKRRAIFRKFGRNVVWKALKKKTKKFIRDRKRTYDLEKKQKILEGKSNRLHECARAFVNNNKEKTWSPRQLPI